MKKYLILCLLILPSFSLMLRPGIHSMHDFHPFRLQQFVNCGMFPCRWAFDAGAGFGEPVFNYYGQFVYWIGSIFYNLGFSILNSIKSVFILTIMLSSFFMYLLSRKHFGNLGGVISALFYVYAPYRSVDIWVRGALPEAMAFVFFPVILLFPNLFWLTLSIAALLITHNLSAMMFLPLAFIFSFMVKTTRKFVIASIIAIFLSSFYLIPLYWEKNLVNLNEFTHDLYQYQLHFTTIRELFFSRFWGYGSSVWGPNDNMSFSVGHLHWILGLIVVCFSLIKKNKIAFLSAIIGFSAIFMTHGKSDIIWNLLPPLKYLQFPWRFLSISTFFLSFSIGTIVYLHKKLLMSLIILLFLLNANYFAPDQWFNLTDSQYFAGQFWTVQRFASLLDYWPKNSKLPNEIAPSLPIFAIGDGTVHSYIRNKNQLKAEFNAQSGSLVEFPIVNFPGWEARINNSMATIIPHGEKKLISLKIPPGNSYVNLTFKDTIPRQIGNLTSLVSLIFLVLVFLRYEKRLFT